MCWRVVFGGGLIAMCLTAVGCSSGDDDATGAAQAGGMTAAGGSGAATGSGGSTGGGAEQGGSGGSTGGSGELGGSGGSGGSGTGGSTGGSAGMAARGGSGGTATSGGAAGKGASGGSSGTGSSDLPAVDPSTPLNTLTTDQKKEICDWYVGLYGGYGVTTPCPTGGSTQTFPTQDICVAVGLKYNCTSATVGEYEDCSLSAVPSGGCNTSDIACRKLDCQAN